MKRQYWHNYTACLVYYGLHVLAPVQVLVGWSACPQWLNLLPPIWTCVDIVLPTQHPISARVDREPPPHAVTEKNQATGELQRIFTGRTFVPTCSQDQANREISQIILVYQLLFVPTWPLSTPDWTNEATHPPPPLPPTPQGLCCTRKFRLIYIWGTTASILDAVVISVFSLISQSLQSQKLWRLHKWHRWGGGSGGGI